MGCSFVLHPFIVFELPLDRNMNLNVASCGFNSRASEFVREESKFLSLRGDEFNFPPRV